MATESSFLYVRLTADQKERRSMRENKFSMALSHDNSITSSSKKESNFTIILCTRIFLSLFFVFQLASDFLKITYRNPSDNRAYCKLKLKEKLLEKRYFLDSEVDALFHKLFRKNSARSNASKSLSCGLV